MTVSSETGFFMQFEIYSFKQFLFTIKISKNQNEELCHLGYNVTQLVESPPTFRKDILAYYQDRRKRKSAKEFHLLGCYAVWLL
jgi:hypothetical protein